MKFNGKKAAELRTIVADYETRITAKMAELKDDTAPDAARKIQSDHDALVGDFEDAKRALNEAVKAEAEPVRVVDHAAVDRASRAAVEAERTRVADIGELGRLHGMSSDMLNEHVRKGTAVDAFRTAVLDALVDKQEAQGGPSGGAHNVGVEVTRDETQTRRDAMSEYIMARNHTTGMTDRAKNLYRGSTAIDLVKETLAWRGESARGMYPDEIVQRAMLSTSDFPNILANVATKTLRQAYEAAPRTFTRWTRNMIMRDFKTYNILRRGETPQLELVGENGEFKRGSISESKETIQLKTYGKVVPLSRQAIINDDLGALDSIPRDFAQSAATLESDLVYGLLLSNPALNQDGVAVFHASHGNLAAAGTALDINPLSAMRSKMSKQLSLDGKTVLGLQASILLVPPDLYTRGQQLLASFIPAKNVDVSPEWIQLLSPIEEPRLALGVTNTGAGIVATGSLTAYYLVSTMVDTIVTATLDGKSGPYIQTELGFNTDGLEIKCRHDFGAAATDFRGLQKDPGA